MHKFCILSAIINNLRLQPPCFRPVWDSESLEKWSELRMSVQLTLVGPFLTSLATMIFWEWAEERGRGQLSAGEGHGGLLSLECAP